MLYKFFLPTSILVTFSIFSSGVHAQTLQICLEECNRAYNYCLNGHGCSEYSDWNVAMKNTCEEEGCDAGNNACFNFCNAIPQNSKKK